MIHAELKGLHSPDIRDLERYRPEDPEKFAVHLEAMVGPKGEEGEESFGIVLCTPRWLEEAYGVDEVIIGRHYLFVREYNYQRIVARIKGYLMHCSGEDWHAVAEKVSRLGNWEFEDYTE